MSGGNWKDLFKAAGTSDIPLAKYHLRQGVDPNFQHPEFFTAPLFEAIRNGHNKMEMIRVLVEEGKADPSLVEELTDQTPLEVALEEGHHRVVDYLNTKLPKEKQWHPRQVLVTGGNRGIGKAICESLLKQGHRVVLTCRSNAIGDAVVQELSRTTQNSKIEYLVGSLSSIQSTRDLAKTIQAQFSTVNTLIHNAGVWSTQKELNEDGLELAFMVNYLAPYLLTQTLGPLLEQNGPDARIVFVSSKLYVFGKADMTKTPYGKDFGGIQSYMNTTQCGVLLFLNTVRRYHHEPHASSSSSGRCDGGGGGVTVTAIHPGGIRTGLGDLQSSSSSSMSPLWYSGCLISILRVVKRLWEVPYEGAKGPVWLASSPEAGSGCHGHFYNEHLRLDPILAKTVTNVNVQKDWEQWTKDLLVSPSTTTTTTTTTTKED